MLSKLGTLVQVIFSQRASGEYIDFLLILTGTNQLFKVIAPLDESD
ncbi:hypothetical protein Pse7367_2692 [Thalassoporum mexicanum PCC 7367]|nr:hypothetical protein Pse7367_2692 [Pseudanabaena sp. PCC 7367]